MSRLDWKPEDFVMSGIVDYMADERLDDYAFYSLKNEAIRCLDRGFSEKQTYRYLRCTEEVNPELQEDVALARMKSIREEVKNGS